MNFVFISPNFPENYWQFCRHLQLNGVTVLGIGDARPDELRPELKAALTEYQRVPNMMDYDQMYRAVARYAAKYGRIDWIESNNEYWLEQDARLRTDFNVTTGIRMDQIDSIKEKSEMKKYYAKGGIRTARQIRAAEGFDRAHQFAQEAGYPLFVKPDVGVGAVDSHKIENPDQLWHFFHTTPHTEQYVIEEFVTGNICTYDGIIDSQGRPIMESMCVCPPSIADIVNYNLDSTYFVEKQMSENLRFWGRRTVESFGIRSRFVHLEFFCLDRAHKGLGDEGDFVALEVNMRPGGGYTPDMINYAHNIDVYKIWADMVAFDRRTIPSPNDNYFCVFAGRRDNCQYVLSHDDILQKYAAQMRYAPRVDKALAGAMGDQAYIARFRTIEVRDEFLYDTCNRK